MAKDETKPENELREISTVLHGQRRKTNKLKKETQELENENQRQSRELDGLLTRTSALAENSGADLSQEGVSPALKSEPATEPLADEINWQVLIDQYSTPDCLGHPLDGLLRARTLEEIERKFGRPLERLPWDRIDAAVVLGAAVIGIVTDWFCAPPGNPLSKSLLAYGTQLHDNGEVYSHFRSFQRCLGNSPLAEKFQWAGKIANMKVSHNNLPIDYRGPGFGAGAGRGWQYHRVLSGGHDLLRFLSGIWQIKNGKFIGIRYEHGHAVMDILGDRTGTSFRPRDDWSQAAIEYLLHVIADFFTKTSLPVPGSTFLRELPNRELRRFVTEMYYGVNPWRPQGESPAFPEAGGYNLRHVIGQSPTPAIVSIIIWLYNLLRYRLLPFFTREPLHEALPGLKLNEMLATAHTLVCGFNIGRVVMANNPLQLNLPQLTVTMQQLIGLGIKTMRRHDPKLIWESNGVLLDEGWTRIELLTASPPVPEIRDWPREAIVIS